MGLAIALAIAWIVILRLGRVRRPSKPCLSLHRFKQSEINPSPGCRVATLYPALTTTVDAQYRSFRDRAEDC